MEQWSGAKATIEFMNSSVGNDWVMPLIARWKVALNRSAADRQQRGSHSAGIIDNPLASACVQ
jgi:hypothetical protein